MFGLIKEISPYLNKIKSKLNISHNSITFNKSQRMPVLGRTSRRANKIH